MFFAENIPIIFILSALAALIAFYAHFSKIAVPQNVVKVFSLINNIAGLVFGAVLTYYFVSVSDAMPYATGFNWLSIGDLSLSFGILADKTSSVFLFVFMLICLIIQLVSFKFYKENKYFSLYFGYFNLLMLAMTAFIFGSNFIQSVIFTFLSGICGYLLLNINFEKINVSKQAQKYLTIDRLGDFLLLGSFIVMLYFTKTYELSSGGEFLSYTGFSETIADIYVYMSDNIYTLLCLVIFAGIAVKSSIFPFHSKLLAAVYDYSPASYIIYTVSTLSGLFLITRFMPIFSLNPDMIHIITCILIIAGLYCDLYSLFQINIQKKEAYCFAFLSALLCIFPFANVINPELKTIFLGFAVFVLFLFLVEILSSFVLENNADIPQEKVKSFMKHFETDGDFADKVIDFCAENVFESPKTFVKFADKYIIGSIVKIPEYLSGIVSYLVTGIQNGNIQAYLICAILFIAILFVFYFIILAGVSGV